MEYWTLGEPQEGEFRMRINHGGRPFWCAFDYLALHAEVVEGVEVIQRAAPDRELQTWFPSIRRGIERAVQALRAEGRLIVMVHVEITKIYTHDLYTTERGCEYYGDAFFYSLVERQGRRIPALDPAAVEANQTNAVRIAQAIQDEQAFDRLAILADALEDAGCTDRAVLYHCRHSSGHVGGCWVVDLVLGRG